MSTPEVDAWVKTQQSPKFGTELANGATVIAAHAIPCDTFIVLAYAQESVYDPYVTWSCYLKDVWICVSGHYYDNIVDAAGDFADRAGLPIDNWIRAID